MNFRAISTARLQLTTDKDAPSDRLDVLLQTLPCHHRLGSPTIERNFIETFTLRNDENKENPRSQSQMQQMEEDELLIK
jgi:hypothetical protein